MKTPGNRIYINLSQGSAFFLVSLGLLVYAFWYSLFSLLPLALADTPISYITLVPVVSLGVAYIKSRYSSIPEVKRDPFVDNSLSALLVLIALFSILLMPAAMSWRYWVYRMDLLLIPVFLLAVLILFRGLHFVALYWFPIAYLFLMSPWLYFTFMDRLVQPLTAAAIFMSESLVRILNLPVVTGPGGLFTVGTGRESIDLLVGSSCIGMSGILGFLVIAFPITYLLKGRWIRKLAWLATGVFLVWLANIIRILTLLTTAMRFGLSGVYDLVHSSLGPILFVGVFALMLLLLKRFGLVFSLKKTQSSSRKSGEGVRLSSLVMLFIAASFISYMEGDLRSYSWLDYDASYTKSISNLEELRPEIAGWEYSPLEDRGYVEPYFGKGSLFVGWDYLDGQGNAVVANVILTRSFRTFQSYTLENSVMAHDFEIVEVSSFDLGYGFTGRIIHDVSENDRYATLYWYEPVEYRGERYYARYSIYTDVRTVNLAGIPEVEESPVRRVSNRIMDLFIPSYSEGDGKGNPAYINADKLLLYLGKAMLQESIGT